MLKQVFAPHLDRNVKFGRRAPTATKKHLKFGSYAKRRLLPVAPALTNYRAKADPVLRDIYGNDVLGDCVIAAGYHVEGVATGNAGNLFHALLQQIIADYSKIGNYVPGDESTDNGCDEDTALTYWCQNGFANGTKLAGYLQLDPSNWPQIQQAIYIFEGSVFFGVGLPDAWISPFPSKDGFTWDVAGDADPSNGHAFPGIDYDARGVIIDTWGLEGVITPKAISKYCSPQQGGQLFVLLTPDVIAKGQAKAPSGFDWVSLVKDFNSYGGNLPVPAPAPNPTPAPPAPVPAPPTPAPPSPIPTPVVVTLAQAQAWANAGLATVSASLRVRLEKQVSAALAAKWPKG